MAAQGETLSQKFDSETGAFTAKVKIDASIDAPTVIQTLVNSTHGEPAWYPNGAKVHLSLETGPLEQ